MSAKEKLTGWLWVDSSETWERVAGGTDVQKLFARLTEIAASRGVPARHQLAVEGAGTPTFKPMKCLGRRRF
jgi:hypothetical protein